MWLKPGADSGTPFYGEEIDVRVRSQLIILCGRPSVLGTKIPRVIEEENVERKKEQQTNRVIDVRIEMRRNFFKHPFCRGRERRKHTDWLHCTYLGPISERKAGRFHNVLEAAFQWRLFPKTSFIYFFFLNSIR
jgi:hypothetical protein